MTMTNEHWAGDPELVERFVSGGLGQDQKKAFEAHLGGCVLCREAVDQEVKLREGIRIYARKSLKNRLRKRLSLAPGSGIPWPHILSAAALLIIIVGIGMQTGLWRASELSLKDADVGMIDSLQVLDDRASEPSAPAVGELSGAEPAIRDRADEIASEESDAPPRRERTLTTHLPSRELAKSGSGSAADVVWVMGIILPEHPPAAFSRSEKKISAAAAEEREGFAMAQRQDVGGPRITASQKPLSLLPAAQQAGVLGFQGVMTALEEKQDSLHMTIYSDDQEVQSQTLHVTPVTDDSVVVTAGKARIAVKIPASMKGKVH